MICCSRAPVLFLLLSLAPITAALHQAPLNGTELMPPGDLPWRVPAQFIENRGQWADSVRFAARSGCVVLQAQRGALTLWAPAPKAGAMRPRLDLVLPVEAGAEPHPADLSFTRYHVFSGDDPTRWRTDLRGSSRLIYGDDVSGVLVHVAPLPAGVELTIDVGRIRWPGVVSFGVPRNVTSRHAPGGDVVLDTGESEFRLTAPRLRKGESASFTLAPLRFDTSSNGAIRIVPIEGVTSEVGQVSMSLLWSTYFGGSGIDEITDVEVAGEGDIVLVGTTESLDVTVTPGALDDVNEPVVPGGGAQDVVVARFSTAGVAEFITYLGGKGGDRAYAASVGPDGDTFIAGTAGAGFPTTPGAFDVVNNGKKSFVTRLAEDGSSLAYSTLFGGNVWPVHMGAIAADSAGRAYFAGTASTPDLPTTAGAFDPVFTGNPDVFIGCLEPDGEALVFCTYLGGPGGQNLGSLALGQDGSVYVAGNTYSSAFPVTPGAFSNAPEGGGFVSRLDSSGSTLLASTILPKGGVVRGVAVGRDGSIYAAGQTYNQYDGFPTTPGAFSTDPLDLPCGYVTRFTPQLDELIYSTFLSSLHDCGIHAVEVDASGVATVAGVTAAALYPTTPGAMFPVGAGGADFVLTRLAPDGGSLIYSTYFGGGNNDSFLAPARLALEPTGSVVLAGQTIGTDVPMTPDAFDPTFNGELDLVVARLELLPEGVVRHGDGTPGCAGPLPMGAQNAPVPGAEDFHFTCSGAPSSSAKGLLVVSLGTLAQPWPVKGASLWVDPTLLLALVPAGSDHLGFSRVCQRMPPAAKLVGQSFAAQFLWPDPCAAGGVSASGALRVTIQP